MRKSLLLLTAALCAANIGCGGAGTTNVSISAANGNANKAAAPANTSAAPNANASNSTSSTNTNNEKSSNASNEALDFTLVNKTGYDIKKLYIGPTSNSEWTEDMEIVNGRKFSNGDTMEVKFNPKANAANWDIRVEWADGSPAEEWMKLDLTQIEKVTLKYDRASDKTTAEIE